MKTASRTATILFLAASTLAGCSKDGDKKDSELEAKVAGNMGAKPAPSAAADEAGADKEAEQKAREAEDQAAQQSTGMIEAVGMIEDLRNAVRLAKVSAKGWAGCVKATNEAMQGGFNSMDEGSTRRSFAREIAKVPSECAKREKDSAAASKVSKGITDAMQTLSPAKLEEFHAAMKLETERGKTDLEEIGARATADCVASTTTALRATMNAAVDEPGDRIATTKEIGRVASECAAQANAIIDVIPEISTARPTAKQPEAKKEAAKPEPKP